MGCLFELGCPTLAPLRDGIAERLGLVAAQEPGEIQERPFAGQPEDDVGERLVLPFVRGEALGGSAERRMLLDTCIRLYADPDSFRSRVRRES